MSIELKTETLATDKAGLEKASAILHNGGLVALPTETVYGLGGDACNGQAVAKIFEAKGRPSFNPLIAHVADLEMAQKFGAFSEDALRLAATFWPGPLTLVVPLQKNSDLSHLTSAGLNTIGLRVPAHPIASSLLRVFGKPIAAPSANLSGHISATSAEHVLADLNGRIHAIVDAGPCEVGVESTIIGFDPEPTLLRPGGLPVEVIEACIGRTLLTHIPGAAPTAPGQLSSHYAPNAIMRLNAKSVREDEILLGFGPVDGATLNLSPSADMVEAAANLFDYMHQLDGQANTIAVSPIPNTGLGLAINDRLTRAAAPR
ncbi:L-threonylcarbamoyladenylate synthase [Cochlodiniinecator piscidefendens]|uniref:L-threonylcarbamoyladenylate synthase n=1 Tax=Cochlodiniinecator piscidefendens TaxID=2715756 RepID=UPI001409B6EE|nr:L-threonylcarbamoyladenylate synthase [Cochlodiniinecator piscidefendens]